MARRATRQRAAIVFAQCSFGESTGRVGGVTVEAWGRTARLGGESLRQVVNGSDFYCDDVTRVEHRLLRRMPSEAHHQVAMREVIEDSMDVQGIAGDLGLGDKCGTGS